MTLRPSMAHRLAVGAIAVAALCAGGLALADAAASVEDLTWTILSADSAVDLTQTASAPNACRLAAAREGGKTELWTAEVCLATVNHLRFVSNDGEKLIVVEPLPTKLGSTWHNTPVVLLYKRSALERTATAAEMVRNEKKIRQLTRHFYWLEGALNVPGRPPRYLADGSGVEMEAIDGRNVKVRFDGVDFPRKPLLPAARPKKGKGR